MRVPSFRMLGYSLVTNPVYIYPFEARRLTFEFGGLFFKKDVLNDPVPFLCNFPLAVQTLTDFASTLKTKF